MEEPRTLRILTEASGIKLLLVQKILVLERGQCLKEPCEMILNSVTVLCI